MQTVRVQSFQSVLIRKNMHFCGCLKKLTKSEIQTGVIVVKRTLLAIITSFTLFAQLFAAETTTASPDTDAAAFARNAAVSIKFYDRTMYYPGNTMSNPVQIHVTITNTGSETLRFKLADDKMFSIDFEAYDIKNAQLKSTDSLIRKRTTSRTVYFREIAIEPGEAYSFIENLKDFININSPSIYYVNLRFYPELYSDVANYVPSNRLNLEIRPSPSAAASNKIPVEAATAAVLQPEAISPDKVIEQTIIARQRSLWDQFFLYMNVEEMLKRDPARSRRYNSESADGRNLMIEAFKADLMQSRIETNIVAIPSDFTVETTTYSQTEGTVKVTEYFKNETYTERKLYTYYVRQRDGIWQIYNYTVDNLGTN